MSQLSLSTEGINLQSEALNRLKDSMRGVAAAAEQMKKIQNTFRGIADAFSNWGNITAEQLQNGSALMSLKANMGQIFVGLEKKIDALARKIGTAFPKLKIALGAKGLKLAALLAPIAAVGAAVAGLVAWWRTLGERNAELKDRFMNIWNSIRDTFESVVGRIRDALSNLGDKFMGLWNAIAPVVDAIIYAIASVLGPIIEYTIEKIGAVIEFVVNIISGFVEFFTGVINVIVGLFTGNMETLREGISQIWSGIVNTIQAGIDFINNLFQAGLNFIINIFSPIVSWVNSNIIQPIGQFFTGLWDGIRSGVQAAVNFIRNVFTSVTTWISSSVIAPIRQFFTGLWDGLRNGVQSAVDSIRNIFSTVVTWISSNVVAPIGQFFTGLWNGIRNGVGGMVSGVVNALNTMIRGVLAPLNALISGLNLIPGVSISTLSFQISAPAFATGGFPEAGQMFLAREAGPELVGQIGSRNAVVNNDQIVESVSSGVYMAVREAIKNNSVGGKSAPTEVKLYLDGKQITMAVERHQRERGLNLLGGFTYGY